MQLVYIANIRWPTEKAHGYQIGKMCEEFSRQNLEVELWLPHRYNDLYVEPFSFYNLEKNFKTRVFRGWGWEFFTRYGGRIGFALQKISISHTW